jgi:hypothetical protein
MEQKRTKSEAELIATVANICDLEACLLFAERASKQGMPALATACIERGKELKRLKATGVKKIASPGSGVATEPMKTHVVAGQTLAMLIEDYETGLPPTTYGDLSLRCGFEGQHNARWFGQVTDLIDAACALAGVPSFALVRVREASGEVNHAAWRKENSHLRDRIISTAMAGVWTAEDFTKIRDALAALSARALGNKKAWNYVSQQVNLEGWAGALK